MADSAVWSTAEMGATMKLMSEGFLNLAMVARVLTCIWATLVNSLEIFTTRSCWPLEAASRAAAASAMAFLYAPAIPVAAGSAEEAPTMAAA